MSLLDKFRVKDVGREKRGQAESADKNRQEVEDESSSR